MALIVERDVEPAIGRLTIDLPLHKKQQLAIESPATEILYGGAAGGGKSHLMRVASIVWCFDIPGLQVYLFRRHFDELIATHMEGEGSYPELLAEAESAGIVTLTQKRIRFHNGSAIFLNHLQYTKSLRKYQGYQFHVLLIDELTHFSKKEYTYLMTRVRMKREMKDRMPVIYRGQFPRVLTSSNPGGIGHGWVKSRFVQRYGRSPFKENKIYDYKGIKGSGGKKRQFIPARMDDNPSLDREEYEETLEGLDDPVLVRAYRDGDWNIAEGSMFGETWRETLYGVPWHVHPGFRIPESWPLWRGGDDGYSNPSAIYWLTEDPDKKTIYVIDEIYRTKMLAKELGRAILDRDKEIELQDAYGNEMFNAERLRGAYDSGAFADSGHGGGKDGEEHITRGEQMNKMGCGWTPVQKWPGSRVAGVKNFHALMSQNPRAPILLNREGKPRLDAKGKPLHDRPQIVFFKRCVNAIRTIPELPRSERDIEDVDEDAETHAFDGVRYGIQFKRGRFQVVRLGGR